MLCARSLLLMADAIEMPMWASATMVASTVASHAAVLYIGPRLMKPSSLYPELLPCTDFVCSARAWPLLDSPPASEIPKIVPVYVLAAIPFFLLQIALEAVIQQLLACGRTRLPSAAKYTGVKTLMVTCHSALAQANLQRAGGLVCRED